MYSRPHDESESGLQLEEAGEMPIALKGIGVEGHPDSIQNVDYMAGEGELLVAAVRLAY